MTRRILAILLLIPASVFAHEGHGQFPATKALHYLTSPEHIIQTSLVVAAFVGFLLFQGVKRLRSSKR